MTFEEWIELQAEHWMHETYYYRDLKACWKAATERAAEIAEKVGIFEATPEDTFEDGWESACQQHAIFLTLNYPIEVIPQHLRYSSSLIIQRL